MICEYCGSNIRVVPDNGVCPNCGGVLPAATNTDGVQDDPFVDETARVRPSITFPKPPIGRYKDVAGYLEIGEDSVTFYRKQFISAHKRTIPFCDLFAVAYAPKTPLRSGFLCVREWKDRNIPVVTRLEDIAMDETTIYFRKSAEKVFYPLYVFLKQCAELANSADAEYRKKASAFPYGRYKGDSSYMELDAHSVTISKLLGYEAQKRKTVRYSEIAEVAFREGIGAQKGVLSIRERCDRQPLSMLLTSATVDNTAITFYEDANKSMRKAYDFLLKHVHRNVKAWSQQV